MTDARTILYREAGPFERALAAAFSDEVPNPIRQEADPATARDDYLPFHGVNESADLWFDDWSAERKRRMAVDCRNGLARLKGTHEGVVRYLAYVDAEVIDTVSYPARFVLGRSALGVTPLQHPPFQARYLVRVQLVKPLNSFVLGRSALGQGALRAVDLEPIRRAKRALLVAKAEQSEYRVAFSWRRPVSFRDGVPFDGATRFGGTLPRHRL